MLKISGLPKAWAVKLALNSNSTRASRWTAVAAGWDNVFIERLWRSLKYECVFLNAFETSSEARTGIGCWIGFYNSASQHPSAYVIGGKRFC